MNQNLVTILGVVVTVTVLILGIGRYVGQIETRIDHLERQQRYLHGSVEVPSRLPE